MVKDIVTKAQKVLFQDIPFTQVHRDCEKYSQLDDSILDLIMNSDVIDDGVHEAQQILSNLLEGRHYSFVFEADLENAKVMLKTLLDKFGPVFCIVEKVIPAAEVPMNIPLYNSCGQTVRKRSDLKLSYKSSIIYCVDHALSFEVANFVRSLNNNF